MKLKTLKDIRRFKLGGKETPLIDSDVLRQEVIKWIRHYESRVTKGIANDFYKMKRIWVANINLLKLFFNITEEDLE